MAWHVADKHSCPTLWCQMLHALLVYTLTGCSAPVSGSGVSAGDSMWRAMNSSTAATMLWWVAAMYISAASRSTLQIEQKFVLQAPTEKYRTLQTVSQSRAEPANQTQQAIGQWYRRRCTHAQVLQPARVLDC